MGGLQPPHPGRRQLADRGQHLPRIQGRQQLHRIGDGAGLARANGGQRKAQAAPIRPQLRHNRLAIQLRAAGHIAIARGQTVGNAQRARLCAGGGDCELHKIAQARLIQAGAAGQLHIVQRIHRNINFQRRPRHHRKCFQPRAGFQRKGRAGQPLQHRIAARAGPGMGV